MQKLKKLLIAVAVFAIVYFFLPVHVQMGLKHNFANVDDYQLFPNNKVQKSEHPKPWLVADNYNKKQPSKELIDFFTERQTCAFLVIQDGKIVYENYWENYNKETISGSFSMAKTINALLIGKLVEQEKISVNDDVKKYVPELEQIPSGKLTVKNVLNMSCDLDWSESYMNIFSLTSESYYGNDLDKLMHKIKIRPSNNQGKIWEYQSICTEILGYIIKNVTKKSIAENAHEYLWNPLGAESDALWSTDKNGVEKSFCCLNATARDFAKLGQMVLQNGKWDSVQVIDAAYIKDMTTSVTDMKDSEFKNPVNWYGYQTWMLNYKGHQIPYFRGILGQFIYVIPDKNAVIVRLGKKIKRDPANTLRQNEDILNYIEAGLQVLN